MDSLNICVFASHPWPRGNKYHTTRSSRKLTKSLISVKIKFNLFYYESQCLFSSYRTGNLVWDKCVWGVDANAVYSVHKCLSRRIPKKSIKCQSPSYSFERRSLTEPGMQLTTAYEVMTTPSGTQIFNLCLESQTHVFMLAQVIQWSVSSGPKLMFLNILFISTVFTSLKSHPVFLKLLTCPHYAFPLRLVNLSKGLFLEKINFPFLIIHCLLVLRLGVSFCGNFFPKHVGMWTGVDTV